MVWNGTNYETPQEDLPPQEKGRDYKVVIELFRTPAVDGFAGTLGRCWDAALLGWNFSPPSIIHSS